MRLHVNMIACTGHGMCAELLPEMISLDPWGYPILTPEDGRVPRGLAGHARRAVAACPTLALLARTAGTRRESLVPGPGVHSGRRNSG